MIRRVAWIVDGRARRPDLPEGVGFSVVEDHGDGTVSVEVTSDPREGDALRIAARVAVDARVKADDLTDEDVATLSALYDPWRPGLAVEVGDLLAWDGTIVECIQAHTTQPDWTPGATPALWKVHRTPQGPGDEPEEWIAGASYAVGEQVTYDGALYQCLQAHTSQVGWHPPAVPALWSLVP